jgi:hypothetical protein
MGSEVLVKLRELKDGYAVIESEYGTWKIAEDDWWLAVEDGRYIGGDVYFVHDADVVRWALKYGYTIDEGLAKSVAKAVLEGADSAPYSRAWVTFVFYVINKLGYKFNEVADEEEVDGTLFEEAVEGAEEFMRQWVEGRASLF